MIVRSVTIFDELDNWIKDFKKKMLEYQRQEVSYATVLNMVSRFGLLILSKSDEFTEKQKSLIREYIEETSKYEPPYAKIRWKDEYLRYMIPKILDKTVNEPWEKIS